ncbi:hypothetical protein C8J56DRAFT_896403 [Mycena floridula]|nr:hypothetical protein C8J56DRAFT_896403 [Mycena floridula]
MACETTTNTTSDPPKRRRSADTTSHLSHRSRKVNQQLTFFHQRQGCASCQLEKGPVVRGCEGGGLGQKDFFIQLRHGKQQYLKHLSSRLSKISLFSGIATDSLGVGPDPGFGGRNFAMGRDNGMGAGPSQIEVNIISRHIQSIVSATVISSLTFCATVRTLKEPEVNGAELENGRLAEQIITTVFIYKCPIIDRLLANF